jgi:REP element-mobilizing transposase RayT
MRCWQHDFGTESLSSRKVQTVFGQFEPAFGMLQPTRMSERKDNHAPVGRLPSAGATIFDAAQKNAGSGDPAYNTPSAPVGPVPPPGVPPNVQQLKRPPRRLRRLHRVWPDRNGNISYLLTMCVDGRTRVLDNEATFERLVAFLLDSPTRYHWFGRRFVIMPDHIHLIARMGPDAIRLGQWMKALKAVVAGLEKREERPVRAPGLQDDVSSTPVGRVPPPGVPVQTNSVPLTARADHDFTRIKRAWRWQEGYHDYKIRTPESESRKWEYVCLNPVRYGLVTRPEEWVYGGEIFYDEAGRPALVRGTPPLLERGMLIEEDEMPPDAEETPGKGTRPTR